VADSEQRPWRRPAGRDISVVVAVLSLIAALVFSALQMRDSARSIDQSQRSLALQQRANDFQTLISVSTTLQRSHEQMTELILRGGGGASTSTRLVEALGPNETIAFSLNRRLVSMPGAETLWGNLLYCNWRMARGSTYGNRIPPYFPELARYVQTYERERPDARCL
jgi:hypothetical protein